MLKKQYLIIFFVLIFAILIGNIIIKIFTTKNFNSTTKEYYSPEEALINYPWLDPKLDLYNYPSLGFGGSILQEDCYPIKFIKFNYNSLNEDWLKDAKYHYGFSLSTTVQCSNKKELEDTFNYVFIQKESNGLYKVVNIGSGG